MRRKLEGSNYSIINLGQQAKFISMDLIFHPRQCNTRLDSMTALGRYGPHPRHEKSYTATITGISPLYYWISTGGTT